MTIILDAMGSDDYPDPEIQAAVMQPKNLVRKLFWLGTNLCLNPS